MDNGIYFVFFVPFALHAMAIAIIVFLEKNQFNDHGEIRISRENFWKLSDPENQVRDQGSEGESRENTTLSLVELLEIEAMENKNRRIREYMRVQLHFLPLMRFSSVLPVVLYFVAALIDVSPRFGVSFSNWNVELVVTSIIICAFLMQIAHVITKIKSGLVDHLIKDHPDYGDKSGIKMAIDLW